MKREKKWTPEAINQRLAELGKLDANARALLYLRTGGEQAIQHSRRVLREAFGPCENETSFWKCGRQSGHLGPCRP